MKTGFLGNTAGQTSIASPVEGQDMTGDPSFKSQGFLIIGVYHIGARSLPIPVKLCPSVQEIQPQKQVDQANDVHVCEPRNIRASNM